MNYRPTPGTEECQICGESEDSLWGRPSDPACILLVCTNCLMMGKAGTGGFTIVKASEWLLGSPTNLPGTAQRYASKWADYRARFA